MKPALKHNIRILLSSLTTASLSLAVNAQTTIERPKLVVGIVINGLDIDKVDMLRSYFTKNGFNRLLDSGVILSNVDYGNNLDATASTGVIFTGASPAVNGISSESYFDMAQQRALPRLNDPSQIGNSTDETLSPSALFTTTISDELKIDTGDLGRVYALSPNASQAIIMAGHSGTSGCWITDDTGRWASTTYYKDLPSAVQVVNHTRPLAARLDTLVWKPSVNPERFSFLPSYKRLYPFQTSFSRNDVNRFRAFKQSAPVNEEIATIAADLIKSSALGTREPLDMINVSFTAEPYLFASDDDNRLELYDAYIKIDRQLDKLFTTIDNAGPGMNNALVFVVGTPSRGQAIAEKDKMRIPYGEFMPQRAESLLNMYLISLHGNGDYVLGYDDRQFYLNRDFIKERRLDLSEIRDEAARFLSQMSGINHALTIDDLLGHTTADNSEFPLSRNIYPERAGDIFISIMPGWSVVDAKSLSNKNKIVERSAPATSAAFLLSPSLKPQTISTPIDARSIAPTVARLLRIRSPNGAQTAPLRL